MILVLLGEDDAGAVLHAFDGIALGPGHRAKWTATLTCRDLSNWDAASQN